MIPRMADGATRMVFLGFGKWARADRIYALEPITGDERGGGKRTRVWIDGIAEPILAGRTERTIWSMIRLHGEERSGIRYNLSVLRRGAEGGFLHPGGDCPYSAGKAEDLC